MKRFSKPAAVVTLPLALLAENVQAAEWTNDAGVATSVEYTDNVCLSEVDEQGEWIGRLTPDVQVTGSGRHANVGLNAAVEVNTLSDSKLEGLGCEARAFGNRKQFAPRLNAYADTVVIDQWLYFDADANIDQNAVSPYFAGGGDTLDRTGNTNTTYRYSLSPYIERRFKDTADLTLRYTWDEQNNSADQVGDSEQETVFFLLSSGPTFSPFSLGLQADYNTVRYYNTPGREEDRDSELKSAQVNLAYDFNRAWQVNGYYGEERNDFISVSDDIDGDYWDLGLRWTPNARTTVDVGTGDRFFGSTPRFSIDYRHKRVTLTASYRKDLTYDRNIRTLDDTLPFEDEFGQPVDPVTGLPAGANQSATTPSNSPILDERFTLAYAWQGRRSSLRISASHSDQTRAEDGRDSTFQTAAVDFSRSLGGSLALTAGLSWDEQDPKEERSNLIYYSETLRGRLGVNRQFNSNMNLGLSYQHTDRDSDSPNTEGFADSYTENVITLTLRVEL